MCVLLKVSGVLVVHGWHQRSMYRKQKSTCIGLWRLPRGSQLQSLRPSQLLLVLCIVNSPWSATRPLSPCRLSALLMDSDVEFCSSYILISIWGTITTCINEIGWETTEYDEFCFLWWWFYYFSTAAVCVLVSGVFRISQRGGPTHPSLLPSLSPLLSLPYPPSIPSRGAPTP